MSDIFSRLAPFIREYIYREKWNGLHGIQEEAAKAVFDGRDHLLIAAGTASGKTEAAFFPVLSVLDSLSREKPLVLYVSPLKALINDQALRLERLLGSGKDSGESSIPVWRWHGDVEANSKSRFLDDPWGVLLITPESLEALLLRRPRELARIFKLLLFAVIDEVHVFMGSDRGSQLICQLSRIESAVKEANHHTNATCISSFARRIGLSATLGDYDGGRRWLSQGSGMAAGFVGDDGSGKCLSLALDYHAVQEGKNSSESFYHSLYNQCRNKRTIIFTNSRLEAEECAASLGALAASLKETNIFQVHHGSVSALLRNEAEEQLKSGSGAQAICATATLELGIDIGDLDRIIQLGPPWSVAAFVQRLGRSGRRNGRAEMYFSVTGVSDGGDSDVAAADVARFHSAKALAAMPWELIRTIAVIQLYLEEKWIEPPKEKELPFSLLVHQTLSILASLGEHSPQALTNRILSLPPFTRIPLDDFQHLVTHLTDCGYIGTTEERTLILGMEGECIVNRHSFYPVFPGDETFRVIHNGHEIGTVNFIPDPLSVLAVGGRRWTVKSIDPPRREIWVCETGDEGNERLWRGRGGGTHPRVVQTMRRILAEQADYAYLGADARIALNAARRAAARMAITAHLLIPENDGGGTGEPQPSLTTPEWSGEGSPLAQDAPLTLFIFPWTGSAGMRTLAAILEKYKADLKMVFLEEETELYFHIVTKLGLPEFRSKLSAVCQKSLSESIRPKELPYTDKYDYLLPPDLLAKQYAANMLDKEALELFL
jgi:ATP-dependent Lhr-like helicase